MLKSLKVKNFRSLKDFEVRKLGQVNLIVGKNNSGKSTVLEALRIYAGNANHRLLVDIADDHDEKFSLDDDNEIFDGALPFESFFTGRRFPDSGEAIVIGEGETESSVLKIKKGYLIREEVVSSNDETGERLTRINRKTADNKEAFDDVDDVDDVLLVLKDGSQSLIEFSRTPMSRNRLLPAKQSMPCSTIPTKFISIDELAKEWDAIALTDAEDIVREALRTVLPDFEDLTFVDSDSRKYRYRENRRSREVKVKINGLSKPVPLNSLGDGMLRVLQLILKVFSAKDGFLLIDEFENGLHYSVQEKIWSLIFKLSGDFNIQIFATTHSWDCIESFSNVSRGNKEIEGVLFRVGESVRKSEKGKVISTVFDENELYNITQSDVEVR